MNQKLALTLLLVITVIWALVFVPCGFMALFTAFLSDGNPDSDAFALVFFGSLSFPVAILIMKPLTWVEYLFRKHVLLLIVSLLPILTLIFPILGISML